MPHLQTLIDTQRIMCLKKYCEDYYSPWKLILLSFLKDHGGKFLLHCNFSTSNLPCCLPIFYRDCLAVWSSLSTTTVLTREQVLNQILWNNQFLRVDGKPIFCRKLFTKGLISLANILTNQGRLKSWNFFKANELNANEYFLLVSLYNSLPLTWKKFIHSNDEAQDQAISQSTVPKLTLNFKSDTLSLDSITSSKVYWKLIETIQVYPSARLKYTTLYPNCTLLTGQNLAWAEVYSSVFTLIAIAIAKNTFDVFSCLNTSLSIFHPGVAPTNYNALNAVKGSCTRFTAYKG